MEHFPQHYLKCEPSLCWKTLLHVQRLHVKNKNEKYAIFLGGKNWKEIWALFLELAKQKAVFYIKMQFCKTFTIQLKLWKTASLLIVTSFFCSQLSERFWISKSQLSLLSLLCLWNLVAIFCMHADCVSPFVPSSSAPDSWERRKFVRTFLRF